jgi:hypothetical protein
MPRFPAQLRRRIQAQLAAAMLLLAGIFGVAWALSIVAGGYVARSVNLQVVPGYNHYTGSTGIVVDGGRVLFTMQHVTPDHDPSLRVIEWTRGRLDRTTTAVRTYDAPRWVNGIGFDWRWQTLHGTTPYSTGYTQRERHVSVPLWLLIGFSAGAGWLLGRRNWLIRRRVIAGLCPACGYDCRATPDHCPECGLRESEVDDARESPGIAIAGL